MAKRKAEQVPQKKICLTFKHEWLDEIVQTDTGRIKLSDIFTWSGVICKFCSEAKAKGEFALEVFHLDQLMRIKSRQKEGPIDLDNVYNHWKGDKDRRQKI